MPEPKRHDIQLVSASGDQIKDFLGVTGDVPSTYAIADGITLTDVRLSKSSGFDSVQYILHGVMTVATGVTTGVLTAWLNDRLRAARKVVATLDGDEVSTELDARKR
jgi:hypothetical protein